MEVDIRHIIHWFAAIAWVEVLEHPCCSPFTADFSLFLTDFVHSLQQTIFFLFDILLKLDLEVSIFCNTFNFLGGKASIYLSIIQGHAYNKGIVDTIFFILC